MAARGERGPGSDLAPRVLVAIPAIIFALIIVDQGGEIWTVGIFALGVVAMGELYTLMGRVRPPALAGFLTLAAMLAAALYGEPRHVIMVLAASFPVTFFFAVLRPRREHVSWAIAVTYFGGRWYGRTPLAPLISPNKTLEGLVAGVIGATLSFWAAGLYQDWLTGPHALLIGALVAISAPVGDLFESMVKRDLEVKDTGKLFGAHGGVLDRLDAVFFTVPVAYYAAVGLGYAS